jgi:hypothetical protein
MVAKSRPLKNIHTSFQPIGVSISLDQVYHYIQRLFGRRYGPIEDDRPPRNGLIA